MPTGVIEYDFVLLFTILGVFSAAALLGILYCMTYDIGDENH